VRLQIGIEGKTYEVEVEVLQDDGDARSPNHGPYAPVRSTLQMPPSPRDGAPPVESDGDVVESKACRSPVAGIVIRVNIQVGQNLQANDVMMVLEAMKMETNVTAPSAGIVKSIKVQPQDVVKVNQVLVEFE